MFDGLDCEIYVQVRPVQVMRTGQLHVVNLSHGRVLKPRKLVEWNEQFPLAHEYPKPVRRYVSDFRQGHVLPRRCGFH